MLVANQDTGLWLSSLIPMNHEGDSVSHLMAIKQETLLVLMCWLGPMRIWLVFKPPPCCSFARHLVRKMVIFPHLLITNKHSPGIYVVANIFYLHPIRDRFFPFWTKIFLQTSGSTTNYQYHIRGIIKGQWYLRGWGRGATGHLIKLMHLCASTAGTCDNMIFVGQKHCNITLGCPRKLVNGL